MEFIFPKKNIKPLRLWLLKKGLVKPKSLSETREAFPFPYSPNEQQKPNPIWVNRHIIPEKNYSKYK